jgi:hypothetical protein
MGTQSIFDLQNRENLIRRIQGITPANTAMWGRMNIYQMLKHCTYWEEWIQGKNEYVYKQELLGKIFGKMALKRMIKDDKPFDKNVPTMAAFKVKDLMGDIESEKLKWISLIRSYEHYSNPGFIHDFFGKMTEEQIGILAFKHSDHHLRQFNS